jgi:hypothetical protein
LLSTLIVAQEGMGWVKMVAVGFAMRETRGQLLAISYQLIVLVRSLVVTVSVVVNGVVEGCGIPGLKIQTGAPGDSRETGKGPGLKAR